MPTLSDADVHSVTTNGFTVHSDAYAYHRTSNHGDLYFLSIQGPQTAVKAIFAAAVNSPPGSLYLLPGLDGKHATSGYTALRIPPWTIGSWTSHVARLPLTGAIHLIMYTKHCQLDSPEKTFILIVPEHQKAHELYVKYLNNRIDIPIHPTWATWLWNQAVANGWAIPLSTEGIDAYLCSDARTDIMYTICTAISEGKLSA